MRKFATYDMEIKRLAGPSALANGPNAQLGSTGIVDSASGRRSRMLEQTCMDTCEMMKGHYGTAGVPK